MLKESGMLEILGSRQQQLLRLLQKNKGGLTLEELSAHLDISRNAVRQHIATLESNGFVTLGIMRPSGGRPEQLYVLTEEGMEFFPRHYSLFAQLLVESIAQESGVSGLRTRLEAMGTRVAQQLLAQNPGLKVGAQKVEKLAEIMESLGYSARSIATTGGLPVIEADNCVFHNLAMKNPEICHFDLALLTTFTGSGVNHEKCMAKGSHVCRFRFDIES